MAAFDFPNSPAIGASSNGYTWDGEKWVSPVAGTVYVSDTPPVAPVNSLWWESDTGNLYVRYYDGDSTQWVLAVPATSAASISAVTYVAQTLTAAQQTVARQNVYAAPFDAMAYSGMQINGSMEVSQEFAVNGGGPATAAGRYIVDGWIAVSNGPQVVNGSYISGTAPDGFTRAMQLWVGTANASPGAAVLVMFQQKIEGYRVARLGWGTAAAQPVTIAFWIRAVRPGSYSGAVRNGAYDRSYPFSFTINAVNIWEYKTITIPGDTLGTWAKDSNTGLDLAITMMAGTSFCAPAGAWTAGNFIGATGTINGVASTSDSLILSGITVLPGIEAPSAARSALIIRPLDQELATCLRYFEPGYFESDGWVGSAGTGLAAQMPFKVFKRATPTMAISGQGGAGVAIPANFSAVAPRTSGFLAALNQCSGSGGYIGYFSWTADARL